MSLISVENAIIIFCLWFDWSAPLMQKPFTVMLVIHPVFNNQWLCPHGYQHIINSQHCKERKSLTKRWGRSRTDVRYNQNLMIFYQLGFFLKKLGTSVKFDLVSVSYLSLSFCMGLSLSFCMSLSLYMSLCCKHSLVVSYLKNIRKTLRKSLMRLSFI